ncbi:MAG: uridine kinase, partial [Nocardioides sp.]
VARLVLDLAATRSPTLGTGRLICIDGPAGSGKTTLAAAIEAGTCGAAVVHTDDLLAGWRGLMALQDQFASLLEPLSRGTVGTYRRFDWAADEYAEDVAVAPSPLLVIEGVGSGAPAYAHLCTVLVHVAAPRDLRLDRGMERDGTAMRGRWLQWLDDEEALFDRDRPAELADVLVDGTGAAPPVVRTA